MTQKFEKGDRVRLGGADGRDLPTEYPWLRRGRVVTVAGVFSQGRGKQYGTRNLLYMIQGRRGYPDVFLPGYHLRRVDQVSAGLSEAAQKAAAARRRGNHAGPEQGAENGLTIAV